MFIFAVLSVKYEVMLMMYLLQADVFTVKNAVSSAVDIMQAMGSSVCYLLSKVELKDPHLVKLVCFSICKMSCLFFFDDGSPVTTITL